MRQEQRNAVGSDENGNDEVNTVFSKLIYLPQFLSYLGRSLGFITVVVSI